MSNHSLAAAAAIVAYIALIQSVVCLPVTASSATNSTDAAPCIVSGIKYTHSQQIERDDPCEFCMCLGGDVFCWWQQQCAGGAPPFQPNLTQSTHVPPATHNHTAAEDEDWEGGAWYSSVESNSTEPPPQQSASTTPQPSSCLVMGVEYKVGEILPRETGTCLQCECSVGGRVTCTPKDCVNQDGFHNADPQSLDVFDVDLF